MLDNEYGLPYSFLMLTSNLRLTETSVRRYLRSLAPLPEPTIHRAHDIRHLVGCARCRRLADERHCVRRDDKLYHGRCFIRLFGLSALLTMPSRERGGLQLSDVGLRIARALIETDESTEQK